MEEYKQQFIDFMIECGALKFGDFVTKSGRQTPFFINTGCFRSGADLSKLGAFYAQAILNAFGADFEVLFGPAYKGIPLSVAAAIALYEKHGVTVRYCSNRKEIKDHGDKGILLGGPILDGDRVVLIEDVTTAGTSVRESMPLIRSQADAQVTGLVVCVDRCERGTGEKSALEEIRKTYGIATASIVTMHEVVEYLYGRMYNGAVLIDDARKAQIDAYYEQWGVH